LVISDKIIEVDPTPYLAVFSEGKIEGWSSIKLKDSLYLLVNRPDGLVRKNKSRGFLGGIVNPNTLDQGPTPDRYFLDSKKNKSTEMIVVVANPDESSDRGFLLAIRLDADAKLIGVPKEFQTIKKRGEKYDEAHGNWPHKKYLAAKVDVSAVSKGEAQFGVVVTRFLYGDDEAGQFTASTPTINSRMTPLILLR